MWLPQRTCVNRVQGHSIAEHIYGDSEDDCLYGNGGDDQLFGEGGNDTVVGGAGNDLLDGGTGNDFLYGGAGTNTYRFDRGAGQDTIGGYQEDTGSAYGILTFGANVLPQQVQPMRCGCTLVLFVVGTTDRVTIDHFFHDDNPATNRLNPVHEVRFANGTRWDTTTLMNRLLQGNDSAQTIIGYATNDVINAGAGDDWVSGAGGNDTLIGMDGDDTLNGGRGDDALYGDDGNDTLQGESGNDTLVGGSGDDWMQGGTGDDFLSGEDGDDTLVGGPGNDQLAGGGGDNTYLFDLDDDHDAIVAGCDIRADKRNILLFSDTIGPSMVSLSRVGNHLVANVGHHASVTINRFFFGPDPAISALNPIQEVRFWGNRVWDIATIKALVLAGNDRAQHLTGYHGNDTIQAGGGDDTVIGNAGHDTLDGGTGDDDLFGNAGDDILIGGAGSDHLSGGEGNDTLHGGTGNDYLRGGTGHDVYHFERGDGSDVVSESGAIANSIDTLQFGHGITRQNLWFSRDCNDLAIHILNSTDQVVVNDWFWGTDFQIEEIRTADGATLQAAEVERLVQAMAVVGVPAAGHTRWTEGRRSDGQVLITSGHY